jgi:sugar lactone lactonase YvrE
VRILIALAAACLVFGQTTYRIEVFAGTDFAGDGYPALAAPLLQPQGLAVDRDGTIIVSDAGDNRIRRFLPNGAMWTIAGDGAPRLNSPYGIAIGPERQVYVADLRNGCVRRIDRSGVISTVVDSTKLQEPRNVAVDPSGILYISDFGANKVYRVEPGGSLTVVTSDVRGPAGIAADGSGRVYIADSGNQRVISVSNGVMKTLLTNFGAPTSIALHQLGLLYVAGGDRVAVIDRRGEVSVIKTPADEVAADPSGALLTVTGRQVRSYAGGRTTILAGNGAGAFAGDGAPADQWRFNGPMGLARDGAGNLFIADSGNGRIRRIDTDGRLSTVAAALALPTYFGSDSSDRLYFSESKTGLIHRMERDGSARVFARGFVKPMGLTFRDGWLYVADVEGGSVKKVAPDGFVWHHMDSGRPAGLAFAPEGTLRVTDLGGLRVDSDGRSVIADTWAGRVIRVGLDGKVEVLAAGMSRPADVWLENDGSILVSDVGANRIFRLVRDETAQPVTGPPVRILHGGTGNAGPLAPGQVAILESDEPLPTGELRVGDAAVQILANEPKRVRFVVPPALRPGQVELTFGSWRVPLEIVAATPVLLGPLESDRPGSRTALLTARITGEGAGELDVTAEMAFIAVPVVSTERRDGQLEVRLQLPGGFLPTGVSTLTLTVSGVRLTAAVEIR